MWLIISALEGLGLILGSLAAAIAICALLWTAFNRIHHPEWLLFVILGLLATALLGWLPGSQFVHMTVAFTLIAAIPFWAEGYSSVDAWRGGRR